MSEEDRERGDRLKVKYNDKGLIAAIVQDVDSGRVLMLGWMNDEALRQTLATGKATFYSRSRGKIWVKGESSGHIQIGRLVGWSASTKPQNRKSRSLYH